MPVSARSKAVSGATQSALGVPEPGANSVLGGGSLPALLDAMRSGQMSAEHIMAFLALMAQAQGGPGGMTDIGRPGLPPGPPPQAGPPGPGGPMGPGGGGPNPIAAAMMGGGMR